MNSQMAQHGLLERSTNSPKLTNTDLLNILSHQEIRAALKGKSLDEMLPTVEVQGSITEIGGPKEDLANKFEALENIMLETPPDFIIVSAFL
jgi:glutaredoxin-related protein